jgi:hypothetical protein
MDQWNYGDVLNEDIIHLDKEQSPLYGIQFRHRLPIETVIGGVTVARPICRRPAVGLPGYFATGPALSSNSAARFRSNSARVFGDR